MFIYLFAFQCEKDLLIAYKGKYNSQEKKK